MVPLESESHYINQRFTWSYGGVTPRCVFTDPQHRLHGPPFDPPTNAAGPRVGGVSDMVTGEMRLGSETDGGFLEPTRQNNPVRGRGARDPIN